MTYIRRDILSFTILLSALLAGGNVRAGVTVHGNVFGGGNEANVGIDATVNISGGTIRHNVYGGGKMGSVGDTVSTVVHAPDAKSGDGALYNFALSWPVEFVYQTYTDENSETQYKGKATVNISGGKIAGDVFGAGKGQHEGTAEELDAEDADVYVSSKKWEYRYAEALIANVRETEVNISYSELATSTDDDNCVVGSVYGGGEDGHVHEDTRVTVDNGLIGGSVFGGGDGEGYYSGKLLDKTTADPYDKSSISNWLAGKVYGNTYVTINGGHVLKNVYGGGNLGSVGKGNYSGGTDDYSVTGYGELPPKSGDDEGELWTAGGPFVTSGIATVTVNSGTIGTPLGVDENFPTGNVFGSSRGKASIDVGRQSPRYKFAPDFFLGYVNETHVKIGQTDAEDAAQSRTAPIIYGSVYGGGQDGHVRRSTEVTVNKGTIGQEYDESELSAAQWKEIGNVLGAGSGLGLNVEDGKYNTSSGSVTCTTNVTVKGGTILQNVYGGGALASVGPPMLPAYPFGLGFPELNNTTDPYPRPEGAYSGFTTHKSLSYTQVNIEGGVIGSAGFGGYVYGASRGADENEKTNCYDGSTYSTNIWSTVNMTGGTVAADVFGGGQAGDVMKDVVVNMTGGTVGHDVYGGGALAKVNTYVTDGIPTTTVSLLGGDIAGDAYGGGLGDTDTEADAGNTKVNLNGIDADSYNAAGAAMQAVFDGRVDKPEGSADYPLKATLKGTTVGRVFGANNTNGTPTGDVTVHVYATQSRHASKNTTIVQKFVSGQEEKETLDNENTTAASLKAILADKITIAGALDISVTGQQEVYDNASAQASEIRTAINDLNTAINARNTGSDIKTMDELRYDVAAVYGGGNEAAYIPTTPYTATDPTGAKSRVIIEGCDVTSIGTVYGGGNAAAVPETNVEVKGAYEIGTVFGGGNGKEAKSNGDPNPGADIGIHGSTEYGTGNANTTLMGGYIHEAYGGSNQKGNIKGKINLATDPDGGDCDLEIEKMVGAGKNADIDGHVVILLECMPTTKVPVLFAGADNANVKGNVELTITNGTFGKVFGGNNESGAIFGHIIVNVEETGCIPINIDELYLCGNQAAYSVYGYYVQTTDDDGVGNPEETPELTDEGRLILLPRQSADDNHKAVKTITYTGGDPEWTVYTEAEGDEFEPYDDPEMNIVSCTYIGQAFGGGYGSGAVVYGNPTVNINQIPGASAASIDADGDDSADGDSNALGEIVNVYGGGNEAAVEGNTTVNIATAATVRTHQGVNFGADSYTYTLSDPINVAGANITGRVFGAGKGLDTDKTAAAVKGNSAVNMGGGSVGVNVYGGGEMASVGEIHYATAAEASAYNTANAGASMAEGDVYSVTSGGTASVTVSGGTVGQADLDPADIDSHGDVFGGGLGKAGSEYSNFAYVNTANVTVSGGTVRGSVFGGGENGHVKGNTNVTVSGGVVGVRIPYAYRNISSDEGSSNPVYAGNVYGGGRGVDHTAVGSHLSETAGRVYGNTHVSVTGGQIHHSVYGGGSLASVGTYTLTEDATVYGGHIHNFTEGTGEAVVSVSGGRIGPTWDELLLDDAGNSMVDAYGDPKDDDAEAVIARNYECLGENEGMVYGSGRGVNYTNDDNDDHKLYVEMAFTNNTTVTISGTADVVGSVFGGGENGHVKSNTRVNIQGGTIGGIPLHHKGLDLPGHTAGHGHIDDDSDANDELNYGNTGIGRSVFRGNVYGGGRGIDHTDGDATTTSAHIFSVSAGRVYGNTEVNVTGGNILHNVFGGGSIASVGTYTYPDNNFFTNPEAAVSGTGKTVVNISGGRIGVMGENEGYVYGGGRGIAGTNETQVSHLAFVNETEVNISQAAAVAAVDDDPETDEDESSPAVPARHADIRASVFGGGMNGHVLTDTKVTVSGGVIGGKTAAEYGSGANSYDPAKFPEAPATVDYSINGTDYYSGICANDTVTNTDGTGPAIVFLGNVYGGGRGVDVTSGANLSYTAGRVYGNTEVVITGGVIYHSVFGGGSIASVGDYVTYTAAEEAADASTPESRYRIQANQPKELKSGTDGGTAVVTITGGRVGTNGRNNGRVYGSSRGMAGTEYRGLGYVNASKVTIGTDGGGTSGPDIRGSVFGSGENGHVLTNTLVEIKSGHIGNGKRTGALSWVNDYIGNVYGGGRGVDRAVSGGETVSPFAGRVYGYTDVRITGGQIDHNVYGGGSLASVGRYKRNVSAAAEGTADYNVITYADTDDVTGITYPEGETAPTYKRGTANVTVSGGVIIGIDGDENGFVFGGSRGTSAASSDIMSNLAYVNYTNVSVDDGHMWGSVFGGGESGHVQNDTEVSVSGGEIGASLSDRYEEIESGSGTDTQKTAAKTAADAQYEMMGSVYAAGRGVEPYTDGTGTHYSMSAGYVRGNATVSITGGTIHRNVYGGGSLGVVGDYGPYALSDYFEGDPDVNGLAKVTVKGTVGTEADAAIGYGGNVFGSSRGKANDPVNDPDDDYAEMAYVFRTDVTVDTGADVWGNVYGGGESGHVDYGGTTVTVRNGRVRGNVFGGGKGNTSSPTAGIVDGPVQVNIGTASQLADNESNTVVIDGDVFAGNDTWSSPLGEMRVDIYKTSHDTKNAAGYSGDDATYAINAVYGGGNLADVLTGVAAKDASDGNAAHVMNTDYITQRIEQTDNDIPEGFSPWPGGVSRKSVVYVHGSDNTIKEVYGGGKQAGSKETEVTIEGGRINNVFGGGEEGDVTDNVTVTVTGGAITGDIYGGGALASTNTANWNPDDDEWADEDNTSSVYKTHVSVTGGSVRDIFGGALGDTDHEPYVYGDILVELNGRTTTGSGTTVVADDAKGAVVGRVFGANNANGTPKGKVTVHVYATQNADEDDISTKSELEDTYDVEAVYGGGNLADYTPADANQSTMVIIEGCEKSSIRDVYGGGNAAAVPGTEVLILGTEIIDNVFGGGNGEAGASSAAHVGYHRQADNSKADYTLGDGKTNVRLVAGTIHNVYGGSNSNGDIRGGSNITMPSKSDYTDDYDCCEELTAQNIFGGGKDADMSGGTSIVLGCMPDDWIKDIYAGAQAADVEGDVSLTITSGKFERVFGGNKTGGMLKGSITVNIEETGGCDVPIVIGELYGGGNQADYSIYGYNADTTPMTADDLKNAIKEKYREEHDGADISDADLEEAFNAATKDNPKLNVLAFTSIGAIYGGGFEADMMADPTVNINIVKGSHYDDVSLHDSIVGSDRYLDKGKTPYNSLPYPAHKMGDIGAIGNVFGGGNLATVYGSTTVNVGTADSVYFVTEPAHLGTKGTDYKYNVTTGLYGAAVDGADITGNVYGGGNLADVKGNTQVNISARENETTHIFESVTLADGSVGVYVAGDVFGGGKGSDDTFTCEKAMVGTNGHGNMASEGNTEINIGNGTVGGSVYGGGEIGRVENNTAVTIGFGEGGTGSSAPVIAGYVFGAGKGVNTHGYSALVRGTVSVTVQGDAKVGQSVYGGGEIATVGRFKVADATYHSLHPETPEGMPYELKDPEGDPESGKCVVVIAGYAEIGPDNMQMKRVDGEGNPLPPDDSGHVFGAGRGVLPYEGYKDNEQPWRMAPGNTVEYYSSYDEIKDSDDYDEDEKDLITFIRTLGMSSATEVTVSGNAFIKGSVYGGSENGHVLNDTHVTIAGGQIGNGDGINERYTDHEGYGEWPEETQDIEESWAECAHWDYVGTDGAPYDPYAKYLNQDDGKYYYDAGFTKTAEGGSYIAQDGHTYYGNVFGGGSGVVPYKPGKWLRSAGSVGGNTTVDITGGHILTSVYGGNEHTDVGTYGLDAYGFPVIPVSGGKCTVNMTGGTLGVPRTAEDSKLHPVTCYLFGAGKGDQRIFFNTWTNVTETEVNVTGNARIYGSTFGGGEDGHIMGDAVTTIGGNVTIGETEYTYDNVIIGTTGISYVDGNVFGGGRGFSGDALTAGTVGGNTTVNIHNGIMLGSIYGGGRLASVGTYFTDPNHYLYGQFQEDVEDDPETAGVDESQRYGYTEINISGGTIGNDHETILTEHTYGGNVFGGSMGRLTKMDGETINELWPRLAQVKESRISISGGTIKSNVYGGGEYGTVRNNASVTVSGGTLWRDVYGGGYGSADNRTETVLPIKEMNADGDIEVVYYKFTPMQFAGCVGNSASVSISDGWVKKNVYGGGEMASVGILDSRSTPAGEYLYFTKNTDESSSFALSYPYKVIYRDQTLYAGTTSVSITGGRIGITGKDFMGPYDASGNPLDKDGTILDWDVDAALIKELRLDNGDVFGGGKGIAGDRYEAALCANVSSSTVTINLEGSTATPTTYKKSNGSDVTNLTENNPDLLSCVAGSVYGGGENGHVHDDTQVNIQAGLIGHGVYGGGKGKDTFVKELLEIGSDKPYEAEIYSLTAGKVYGNTNVTMSGGTVMRNVYGGGNMASVGKGNYAGGPDDYSVAGYGEKVAGGEKLWENEEFLNSGKSKVIITGGTVGTPDGDKDDLPTGNVFGGCRGEAAPNILNTPRYHYAPSFFSGYINETEVIIGGTDDNGTPEDDSDDVTYSPVILGSVYGGGQDGHVRRSASVTVNSGEIGLPYTAANRTAVGTDDLTHFKWLHRGNVYGAGSGIGKYQYDLNYDGDYKDTVDYENPNSHAVSSFKEEDYGTSSGSVTDSTKVIINGGTIHHNVYGGGSLASIGPPFIPRTINADPVLGSPVSWSKNQIIMEGGTVGSAESTAAGYGGNVYGASRGETDVDKDKYATTVQTDILITGGHIYGNVLGGGDNGKVSYDTNVVIGSAEP